MSELKPSKKELLDPKYTLPTIVQGYCDFVNNRADGKVKDKPIIITHSYIVSGEIVLPDKIKDDVSEMPIALSKAFLEQANSLVNESFSKEEASEFIPKVLIMKDVTIRSISSNQIITLSVFNVFVDQIVGYSFGHID